MHRYNHKVGLVGLLVGVIILAIGLITHHAELAGSLAMATILVATIAAYYYPHGNDTHRSAATNHEHRIR